MTIDEAARILLNGVCRPNVLDIARNAGVPRTSVERYIDGTGDSNTRTRDRMHWFVWRRLNAHLLITEADRACETCRPVDIGQIA